MNWPEEFRGPEFHRERHKPVEGMFELWYATVTDPALNRVLWACYVCPFCEDQFRSRIACVHHCQGKAGSFQPTCPKLKKDVVDKPLASDFLKLPVTTQQIEKAKEMRRRRDAAHRGNVYGVEESDWRWVGELGEIVFSALEPKAIWNNKDRTAGESDFRINGKWIGLKTVKRRVPFRKEFTNCVSPEHAKEPSDYFLFASYEFPAKIMWFIGGCTRDHFLRCAEVVKKGERIHDEMFTRHDLLNIKTEFLTDIPTLLAEIKALKAY